MLCACPAWGGEKGWLGSAPGLSPAPQGSRVRPGAASFPCARHRTPPTRAGVLPWMWHSASLAMAMGSRGVRGEKELPGPWSPCSLPPPGMWSPAPHSMGATGARQADREQGWGELGRYWMASLVQRDSCWGCPDTPMLGQQTRTLPYHRSKPPGLLPPRADGAARQCHPPCPRRTPHRFPASLGTCPPQHIPHAWEGAVGDSPSPAPAGLPGRVTAGRLHARAGVGLCTPGEPGTGGFLEGCPPSSTPRRGQVTSLFLARRRSVRRGPRRSLACASHAPDAEGMTHAKPCLQLRDHQQRGWGEP